MKRILVIVSMGILSLGWSITGPELLKKLDALSEMRTDITARVTISQQKGESIQKLEAIYYRRDADDSFLIVMTAPDKEKGNGYLKVGENLWMYKRNTRTFQHISRDESVAGTDARSGDLEKRKLSELYTVARDENNLEKITEEKLGSIPVYKVELIARVSDVTYPKQILWIHKENFLVLKALAFALSGTLMQTIYYLKYTQIQGRYIPLQQIFIDEFDQGNKTIFELSGISFDRIPGHVFTKAYLENLSK
ncbi:outer membrane lipoprotein-sorting protein [Thermospira aquatica]|uniref:Outer membrane lipoprotein-sorting protein n=1 Tax=Thermospira aquatica TaxID=2828656 RepID=A0AAX3BBM9_9SPIR|nr:outer membrane lipoprotein-sorting protein [Thermospira aquatica]URA09722.1 outer membrane lipoprotein-sorting protein [Thermospira aquatica]